MATPRQSVALIYGAPLGTGGLGVQSLNALRALASGALDIDAIGPGAPPPAVAASGTIRFHRVDEPRRAVVPLAAWMRRRWRTGDLQLSRDRFIGEAAAERLRAAPPAACYAFTQVALEPLRWARAHGIPTVLESPNGHLRSFQAIYADEHARWCPAGRYTGHPTRAMVERVEEEYALADRIRVSSDWSRDSLVARGVPTEKVTILQQPVDLRRYTPGPARPRSGELRACFVGSLDLRKGFPYLLEAMARLRSAPVSLHLVGATGDSCCRTLLAKLRQGLPITDGPGDPRPALAQADVFVLPTLEDGSPFAVAEAMAAGLPVITTSATGAAEWITPGVTGWIVPPRDSGALASALLEAVEARERLGSMGRAARSDTERRAGATCDDALWRWFAEVL